VVSDDDIATLTLCLVKHLLGNIDSQECAMHLVLGMANDKTRIVIGLLKREWGKALDSGS
jgi:hypothetical protein